jgi:hypothetical protein
LAGDGPQNKIITKEIQWDHLTMGYFDSLDNEFSNAYEKKS